MAHAIRVHKPGGPDAMVWEEVSVGDPGEGQVRLRHTAVGLNYIDVYFRTGMYPAEPPFSPGLEAAGVVDATGEGVTELKVGDRVAYASPPVGAYSEERLMPADRLVKVPDSIDDQTAAAMMLQGMTVEYLLRRTWPVSRGDTILFHAAAGGVGLIACQWARHLGVNVIGTVGSKEKAELAKANGCTHTILYNDEDFQERVMEITDGRGVPVVYDAVGKTTFDKSLDCLHAYGTLVSFGQSSGAIPPVDIGILAGKGSLYVTRPTLMTYTATRRELVNSANALFDVVSKGAVNISVNQTFKLKEAAKAHEALEGRKTTGSTVLTV